MKPPKPVIYLAAVRGEERNVTAERETLHEEGRQLGLDETTVAAVIDEALLTDWLVCLSRTILTERCEDHPDPATIVKLVQSIRGGIERRVSGGKGGANHRDAS
jgi:hypothetical protein